MSIRWLFDEYLMMIVWVISWNDMQSERLTQYCIRQPMLPQNTGGQACTSSEGNLWFASFITASPAFRCAWCIQPSGKSWLQRGRQPSASSSATRVRGIPPLQGRTRSLTKSWIGASRLAASIAQEARNGPKPPRAREGGKAAAGDRSSSSRRELGKQAPGGGFPATPFRYRRWKSFEHDSLREDANSPLQILHLKF